MSVLKLKGSTSGYVELSAPAAAGDNTITLPTTAGTSVVTDVNGDTNIGTGVNLSVPTSDTFTVSTNGSERIRVSAGGSFGIGTDDPISKLHISDTDGTTTITGTRGSGHSYKFETTGLNAEGFHIMDVDNSQRAWLYYAGANPSTDSYHTFNTNGLEKLRITHNGSFEVGGSSSELLKTEYNGTVTVSGPNVYSFAFRSYGAALGGGGKLFVWGTSGNVVVNCVADIIVNHFSDITIKSMSGAYSQTLIKVTSNNNESFDVYLGRDGAAGATTLAWKFLPYGPNYVGFSGGDYTGSTLTHTTVSGSFYINAAGGGAANVNAAGSKNFLIDHPLVGLSTIKKLAHAAIEGPECNTFYRGKVDLVSGSASINLDTNSRMSEGTFESLNQNVQCFTTNETGWTPVKGFISGNLLTITAQDSDCVDTISWLVVGERKDNDIVKSKLTDSNGRFVPEQSLTEQSLME